MGLSILLVQATIFGLWSAIMAFKLGRIVIVPYMLWHRQKILCFHPKTSPFSCLFRQARNTENIYVKRNSKEVFLVTVDGRMIILCSACWFYQLHVLKRQMNRMYITCIFDVQLIMFRSWICMLHHVSKICRCA